MKRFTPKQEAEFVAAIKTSKALKEQMYLVSFDNYTCQMTESELLHFTKTAIIKNKDIKSYTVTRI